MILRYALFLGALALPSMAFAGEPTAGKICSFQGAPAKVLRLGSDEAYNPTTNTTRRAIIVYVLMQGGPRANQQIGIPQENLSCP
jgi:hypothetical protein